MTLTGDYSVSMYAWEQEEEENKTLRPQVRWGEEEKETVKFEEEDG